MKRGEREKTKIDSSITFNSHSEGLRRTVAAAAVRCGEAGMRKLWPRFMSNFSQLFGLSGSRGFQSWRPSGGPDYLFSFGENELSWKLHYLPGLMWANFSHTAINSVKPFGNAQWSVSCSSVSAWHSLSQLSPELSLCDNSRLGLVSLRQDESRRRRRRQKKERK